MSLLYRIAKPIVKPFARGRLEKGMKDPAAFMETVKAMQAKPLPLEKLHKKYDFEETDAGGTVCYKVHSRKKTGHKLVLYFFGGGYCMPGDSGDFEFGSDMADNTGAEVWLVWYDLFPDASGYDIARSAADAYEEALKSYTADEIALYGNSSGAALCFNLCIFLRKYRPEVPLPAKIAAHSPSMRIPANAEEQEIMDAHDKTDFIIPARYLNMYTDHSEIFRTGGFDEFASPIEQDWKGFPKMLLIFGRDEVFIGYLQSIERKCREDGVELETFVGAGCHCFSAAGILPEAKAGRARIYEFLRK